MKNGVYKGKGLDLFPHPGAAYAAADTRDQAPLLPQTFALVKTQ